MSALPGAMGEPKAMKSEMLTRLVFRFVRGIHFGDFPFGSDKERLLQCGRKPPGELAVFVAERGPRIYVLNVSEEALDVEISWLPENFRVLKVSPGDGLVIVERDYDDAHGKGGFRLLPDNAYHGNAHAPDFRVYLLAIPEER